MIRNNGVRNGKIMLVQHFMWREGCKAFPLFTTTYRTEGVVHSGILFQWPDLYPLPEAVVCGGKIDNNGLQEPFGVL